jgi:hypothetical protein
MCHFMLKMLLDETAEEEEEDFCNRLSIDHYETPRMTFPTYNTLTTTSHNIKNLKTTSAVRREGAR